MFSNFKKAVITFSLIIAATFSSVQRADAVVGLCSWNPPLMGAGLLIASLGYGVSAGAGALIDKTGKKGFYGLAGLGIAATWLGQIMLEDGSVGLEYLKITPELQDNLKLSNDEVASFNNELDQVNMITLQVAQDLEKIDNPSVEDSQIAWKQYSNMVSQKTFSVMGKVTKTMFKE